MFEKLQALLSRHSQKDSRKRHVRMRPLSFFWPARTLAVLTIAGAMAILPTGCATGIGGPDSFGILYYDVSHSESRDTQIGRKRGEACQASILTLFAAGDNSIPLAANSGAIREVTNVVFRNQGVLFGLLWHRTCTIVYGK